MAKLKAQVQLADLKASGYTESDWMSREELFTLLQRTTASTTEANKVVKCAQRQNGFGAWRLLALRYEPKCGVKRTKELGERIQLMTKR